MSHVDIEGIDAVLHIDQDGVYDFEIGPDGDILTAGAFDTAIIVSALTDRRAAPHEVQASHLRRGWIGNEATPDFEMGSKLWLLDQARTSRATANLGCTYLEQGLRWMVDDGYAHRVLCSGNATVEGVTLSAAIERPNSEVEHRHFELWENTGG